MNKIILVILLGLVFNTAIGQLQIVDTLAIFGRDLFITMAPANEILGESCIEADNYCKLRNYKMAVFKYEEAIEKGENLAYAHWNIGMLLYINQKNKKAFKNINKSILYTEGSKLIVDKLINEGDLYEYLGRYQKAEECYSKVLEYNNNDTYALSRLTGLYYYTDKFNLSVYLGKRLFSLDTTDMVGIIALGMSALEIDSFGLAVDALSCALHQDSTLDALVWEPRLYRATAYYFLNQYEESKNDLNIIDKDKLISDWGRSQYYFYKTLVNIKLGNHQESIESFNDGKSFFKRQDLKILERMLNL
jgi:tetratricopeptide (TPR) repeat protein